MRKGILSALIIITSLISARAAIADLTADQRLSDARTIIDLYEHRYAPAPWKKDFLGIDMDALADRLLAASSTDITDEEFYTALARYVADLKDTHVNLFIPSSYLATLGFGADYIGGQVVITGVNRNILSKEKFPFETGDRLVSMNGFSVMEVIEELSKISTTGMEHVDRRINARNIPWREQELFPAMPDGTATVAVQPAGASDIKTVELEWITSGMPLAPYAVNLSAAKSVRVNTSIPRGPLEKLRDLSAFKGRDRGDSTRWHPRPPAFPLWENFKRIEGAPLFAGTAEIAGRNIAFMRITTFMDPMDRRSAVLSFLDRQIPAFQSSTEAMIIDLTGNGGGYICYAEEIASFLIDKPIESIHVQIKPTRPWAVDFEDALEWASDDNERTIIANTVEKIRAGLASGTDLTEPLPICYGDGTIRLATESGLASATYTKPILILVDELNASAGEMFPALLQDADRALVFGTRTMGAGGSVGEVGPVGNSDVIVTITESLVRRSKEITAPNGTTTRYIENVGVIPDIPYEVTLDDYLNGYGGYVEAVEEVIAGIKPSQDVSTQPTQVSQ